MAKYYTTKEVMAIFEGKSDRAKVHILSKALKMATDRGGSYEYTIASAMGFSYSDAYNEPTYTLSKY